jgi:flagellar protein FliL
MTHKFSPAKFQHWILILICTLLPPSVQAESESETQVKVQYIEMKPSFVLNYGEPSMKLRYAKIDISLRVNSQTAAENVETHMPALRNAIVMLLSRQSAARMGDTKGREAIRKEAMDQLNAVLKEETGTESVEDLLFTAFVVQQ